jgi:hypothetical protein
VAGAAANSRLGHYPRVRRLGLVVVVLKTHTELLGNECWAPLDISGSALLLISGRIRA